MVGEHEVTCGRSFRLPVSGGLHLVGRFPDNVKAGPPSVGGTVEVISNVQLRGVAAPAADAFLVRDGRVVTTPMAQDAIGVRWDLAPGETKSLPAAASLVSCEPGAGALEPGSYELYARIVLIGDDGATTAVFGGPWPLRVD